MRLTIVNLFLGAWRGRFGRHPCTKAPAIEPAICGASVAADGGYMSRWRERGKAPSGVIPGRGTWRGPGIHNHDREYGFRARRYASPRNDRAVTSTTPPSSDAAPVRRW